MKHAETSLEPREKPKSNLIDLSQLCDCFGIMYDDSEYSVCPSCYGESFCKDLHKKIYHYPEWLRDREGKSSEDVGKIVGISIPIL